LKITVQIIMVSGLFWIIAITLPSQKIRCLIIWRMAF